MRASIDPVFAATACLALALPTATLAQSDGCAISRQPPRLEAGKDERGETALPISATPHFGVHGQLLYGENTFYLSHLAVFMGEADDHPHNFQVVLEVAFENPAAEATYLESRRSTPDGIFTAVPQRFDQMALVADEPGRRLRRTMPGTRVVRGHFEQGGEDIMPPTELELERVVYFREFVTGGEKLGAPSYLLFGRSDEVFLTHLISAPPDFQQILKVAFTGEGNTQDILPVQLDDLLARGLFLALPDRGNTVDDRLRPGDVLACSVNTDTRLPLASAGIRIIDEVYCEEGELSSLVMGPFNDPAACEQ